MSTIRLDGRLQAALLLAQPCGVCADIGADHGRLSAALLQSGRAKHVLAADVSAPSLNKAKHLLGGLGLSDRATFAVADGLRALDALNVPAETVFVLGMGGQTLSRILEEGHERLHGATLVLGAQTDLPLLRETLCQIGYRIRQEQPVKESGRYYLLMQCPPAEDGEPAYDERQQLLGPVLLREHPPLWRDMLERRERLLQSAVSSMEQAKTPVDGEQLALYRREMDYVRQALQLFE